MSGTDKTYLQTLPYNVSTGSTMDKFFGNSTLDIMNSTIHVFANSTTYDDTPVNSTMNDVSGNSFTYNDSTSSTVYGSHYQNIIFHDFYFTNLTNDTESNRTDFPEQRAADILWVYSPPVLLLIGTFGNVATIIVYGRMTWGDSTQPLFLTSLAVADLCVLFSGLIPDIAYQVFGFDLRGSHDAVCKLSIWFLDSSAGASTWILVAMTTQRAISITWPHRVSYMYSHRRTRLTIGCIVAFQAMFESHQLYGLKTHDAEVHLDGACAASEQYHHFWENIWPWIEMSINSSVPSLILVVSNVALVRSLRSSTKSISNFGSNVAVSLRKKNASSTTMTIILVSVTFLLLAFPIDAVIITWNFMNETAESDPHLMAKLDLAWAASNMTWYANSAVNFLLYCVSATAFRREFMKCVTCRSKRQKRRFTFVGTQRSSSLSLSVFRVQTNSAVNGRRWMDSDISPMMSEKNGALKGDILIRHYT